MQAGCNSLFVCLFSFILQWDGAAYLLKPTGLLGVDGSRPTCKMYLTLTTEALEIKNTQGCERIISVMPQESCCMKTISLISAGLINTPPNV